MRFCIVLLTGIGDVVHALPIANALKRSGMATHITWVTEPAPSFVLRPHPAIDDVIVYNKKLGARGVRELHRALRDQQFDVTLNLHIYFKGIWGTLFSRSPRRIGFDRGRSRDGVWLAANELIPARPRAHTQDQFLEFLDYLKVPRDPIEWNITFTPEERAAQTIFFEQLDARRKVTIVPASSSEVKDWIPARYARVIDALQTDFGARVVLAGGPSAREWRIVSEIVDATASAPAVALCRPVRRLMWIVAGSDLVIAPDTGPLHIARALEVPVIGLYGHTNPWRMGPYRKYEDLWVDRYTEPGTPPDPSNREPKSGRMELITVEDVLERVDRAFRSYVGNRDASASEPRGL